jgi:hypothetical protein
LLTWVVIHDLIPSINIEFEKMAMHLFVKETFTVVKIRVGSVYKFFDDIGQIIILS